MSEAAHDFVVTLLWLNGACIVTVVVAMIAIAWASRERRGLWTGDE